MGDTPLDTPALVRIPANSREPSNKLRIKLNQYQAIFKLWIKLNQYQAMLKTFSRTLNEVSDVWIKLNQYMKPSSKQSAKMPLEITIVEPLLSKSTQNIYHFKHSAWHSNK